MQKILFSILTFFLLSISNIFCQIPSNLQPGLIAYYAFSGNTFDSSGNNNHGVVVNSVNYINDRNGKANSAISLNGGYNAGRIITNSNMFNFRFSDSFSIAFWFLDAGSTSGRLVSTENPEGNFRISTYGGGIYAFQYGEYLFDTVLLNQWNYIVYTYTNRTVKLYKNGILKAASINNSIEPINYGTPFTIGSKASSAFDTWNGKIDDIAVWNRAITPTEVAQLYNGSILPVNLLSFIAKNFDGNVQLNWQTENEINFSHFEIEYSINGIDFKQIASLLSSEKTYLHYKPTATENYYRLKMVDKDGKFSYSSIVKVQIKKDLFIQVYPNPIKDFAKVSIHSNIVQTATIFITDATGKIVFKQNKSLSTGLNDFTINTSLFIVGVYQLSVVTDKGKENYKIVKL